MKHHQLKPTEQDKYYLSRNGELQIYGPFTIRQVYRFVENSQFGPEDNIYHQNWSDWQQVGQALNICPDVETIFGKDGQDPHVLEQSFNYMESRAIDEEILHYIAVQHAPARKITSAIKFPKSVIVTNHRICVLEPKLIGEVTFDAYPIEYVDNVLQQIKRGANLGSFHIVSKFGTWRKVTKIPFSQLEQLIELSRNILSSRSGKEHSSEDGKRNANLA